MNKKITLATLKSFVKKNSNNLYINLSSQFNSMTDCVESFYNNNFSNVIVNTSDINYNHTLGINGAWLVGSSRDYMSAFENDEFVGIYVHNCCGSFTIVTKK